MKEDQQYDELRLGFAFLLHDSARLMNRYYDRKVHLYGITRTQWTLLTYLSRYEGVSQTTLADYMDLAPMTLTRQIDKLEKDGLLERRQNARDRRTNLIYLTAKALPLMNNMRTIAIETKRMALNGFTEEEEEQLRAYLARVRSNLTAV